MRSLILVAMVLLAGSVLAACGSSSTSGGSTTSTVPDGRIGNTAAPPCSRGCDVPTGAYSGKTAQGTPISFRVSVLHQKSGPTIVSTVHAIDTFDTWFVVDCGGKKANSYFKPPASHVGYIDGVGGFMRYGSHYMDVVWAPGEPIQGVAKTTSPGCTGSVHFTVKRTGA